MSEKGTDIQNEIEEGLRHIAFGSCADAVKLLLQSEALTENQIKKLDLFNIAGIKRTGGGISEIKFYDRIKAMETLSSADGMRSDEGSGFIEALAKSAELLKEEDDNDEF